MEQQLSAKTGLGSKYSMALSSAYLFILECGFLATFFTVFYDFLSFSVLLFSIIYSVGFVIFQKYVSYHSYFFLMAVPLLVIFYLIGFPLWGELIIIVYFYKRLLAYIENQHEDFEVWDGWILSFLLFSFFFYILNSIWFGNQSIILLIIVLEFFIFSVGIYFIRYLNRRESKENTEESTRKKMLEHKPLIWMISGTAIVLVFFFQFNSLLRDGITLIFGVMIEAITPIIDPIYTWLNSLLDEDSKAKITESLQDNSSTEYEDSSQEFEKSIVEQLNFSYIDEVLYIILFITIFYLIFKTYKRRKELDSESVKVDHVLVEEGEGFYRRKKVEHLKTMPYSKAYNDIRKEVIKVERIARKQKRERKSNESLRDWLDRIGLEEKEWIELYENVRYSHIQPTTEQVDRFKQMANRIIMRIKDNT
ncbi:hypothetical protein WAK64_02485 [Bacillus spongiae]|uniref:DUF4129 domain-containing protein n=1 Tax=Bacillus spongiae TaxID=2683610 RepID=A0ABU8H9E1_9BACI